MVYFKTLRCYPIPQLDRHVARNLSKPSAFVSDTQKSDCPREHKGEHATCMSAMQRVPA